jgi:type IX secretion system PorP/SprF family membrane protein
MRKIFKILFTLFFFLQFSVVLRAQEFVGISQYMYHKQFYNPAAMSSYNDINAVLLYRNQWVGLDGAPSICAFNGSIPFKKIALGLGIYRSKIGVHETNEFLMSYSYRLKVGYSKFLALGLSAGFKLHKRNYSSIKTHEMNDDLFSLDVKSNFVPKIQFGIFYFSSKYYVGFSVPSLISDKLKVNNDKINTTYSFESRKLRLYLDGGYEYDISDTWILNASSLVKYESNSPLEVDFNIMSTYHKKLGFGLSYRTKKEGMALINIRLNKQLRFGYAYHMTFIRSQILNSHEVILLFNMVRHNKGRLKIQSPRF